MTVAATVPGGGAQASAPGPATVAAKTGGGTPPGGVDDQAAGYRAIRDAIERVARRSYPLQARKLGIKGVVTVRFTVGGDGAAKDLTIVSGSGSDLLDEAARAIVFKAGPYPAVPEPVQIPIRFSLDN
jgi:protein TonB